MYSVNKQVHPQYGNVIEITREEFGEFHSPFDTYRKALCIYREWKGDTKIKIRVLVDGQILTLAQADSWSIKEYKSLPKCESCAKILDGEVLTHQLSDTDFFCSKSCADNNYNYKLDKYNDNEESEFEC